MIKYLQFEIDFSWNWWAIGLKVSPRGAYAGIMIGPFSFWVNWWRKWARRPDGTYPRENFVTFYAKKFDESNAKGEF